MTVKADNLLQSLDHICRDMGDTEAFVKDISLSHNIDTIELESADGYKDMCCGRQETTVTVELVIVPLRNQDDTNSKNQPF